MVNLQSGHISFIEICSRNNFYGNSLPTADPSWAVVSCYWRKYGHLVLVNGLGSLPRNSVDRLADLLDMTLIVLTGPYNFKQNKQNFKPKDHHASDFYF